MLGGYISDLDAGDVFKPVEYELTAFMVSEYAHSCEENWEGFHAPTADQRQMRPPTMIHVDKMRILEGNCDKEQRISGMKGPNARVHYEFNANYLSNAFVGETLIVSGKITDRYIKRGRLYIDYHLEVRTKEDDRLIVSYTDKTLLKYALEEETK